MRDYRITKIKAFSAGEEYTFEIEVCSDSIANAMSRARKEYPDARFEGAHCKRI